MLLDGKSLPKIALYYVYFKHLYTYKKCCDNHQISDLPV